MRAGIFATVAVLPACVRDPAPAVCPDVAKGDLVVTEVHGVPSPDDGSKPWVEIYNASSATVDLFGARIRFRKLDGSSENDVIVRRSLEVAAGAYVVLGLDLDDTHAPYMDYGFAGDYKETWLSAAAIQVESCGELVDAARYESLPKIGTFSLGTMPPDADANDLPASWCVDTSATGTPRAANKVCP